MMMTRSEATNYALNHGEEALYLEEFPRWGAALTLMPPHTRGGIARWVLFGVYTGSFLAAVVESDLFLAVEKADDTNVKLLPDYCRFFYNYTPDECFGSAKKMQAWHDKGGYYGLT